MREVVIAVLVMFFLVLPGFVLLIRIMSPVEDFLGRILPWQVKWVFYSVAQALLASVLFFGLGVFIDFENGMSRMQHHPIAFIIVWVVATVAFLWMNIKTEFQTAHPN